MRSTTASRTPDVRERSELRVYFSPGLLMRPVDRTLKTTVWPPIQTALVRETSSIFWSSRIGGEGLQKSSDLEKSKGDLRLRETSLKDKVNASPSASSKVVSHQTNST